jgi:hypothetical protein
LDDLERFETLIQDAIDAGEVGKFKKFPTVNKRDLAKRKSQAKKEAAEANKLQGLELWVCFWPKKNPSRRA